MGKAINTCCDNMGYFNPPNVYRPAIIDIRIVGEYSAEDGATNTYRITQNDGKIFEFDVKNGSGGSAGRSVTSVEQIQVSTESLGKNIARIYLSDGTYTDVEIRNGAQGQTGPQGERGPAGIDSVEAAIGTNDPTQAPSVDKELTEGVLSLTFNNIKGEKGDQGEPAVAVENYVTVEATAQTTAATDVLPPTGSADTVYRVSKWDGRQYDDTAYTEYGWYDGAYKKLATRTPGIDDEPTANSQNLVKSGGVASQISQLGQKATEVDSLTIELSKKSGVSSCIPLLDDERATQITNRIFILKPKIRLNFVNAFRFLCINLQTIYFYKVTINDSSVNYSLIKEFTPPSDLGVKEFFVKLDDVVILGENDYIGINGSFAYTNNTTEIQARAYYIQTGVLTDWAFQSLSIDPLFFGTLDEIEQTVNNLAVESNINKELILALSDYVTLSDKYDFSDGGRPLNQPQMLYFIKPILRLYKINCIEYKSVAGTTYFYLVTYDVSGVFSYELIKTETNTTSGIKRIFFDTPIELAINQYIGIGGNVLFEEVSGKGYGAMGYNISNAKLDEVWRQRNFFFNTMFVGEMNIEDVYKTIDDFVDQDYGTKFDIPTTYSIARFPERLYLIKKIKNIHSVNKLSFFALNGNVRFYKVTYIDGSSSITEKQEIANIVLTAEDFGKIKDVMLNSSIVFNENDYLGISGDNLAFVQSEDGDGLHYSKDVKSNNTVAPSGSWYNRNFFTNAENVSDSLLREDVDYCKNEIKDIKEDVSALQNQFVRKYGTKILFNETITNSSNDVVMMDESAKSFDEYGLQVISGNGAFVNRCYALSDFNVTFRCKFSTGTRVYICGIQKGSGNLSNGAVLDMSNNMVSIGSASYILQNQINISHEYLISLRKLYEIAILEIHDMQGGTYETFIYQHTGPGGSGAGAMYPSNLYVSYWDKPLIGVTSGSVSVKSIKIDTAACKILFYGDSITEGQNYWPKELFEKYWINQVIKMANGNAQTSARSGYGLNDILSYDGNNIDNANSRIGNELPYIKPKYVVVTIGTNGGVTQNGLMQLVNYIRSQGSIPILNHIPTFKHGTNPDTFISTNATIDVVRNNEQISGADFDKATSEDGNGTVCDISQFWLEGDGSETSYYHHPNVKGSATMMARVLTDIPEIFDI